MARFDGHPQADTPRRVVADGMHPGEFAVDIDVGIVQAQGHLGVDWAN